MLFRPGHVIQDKQLVDAAQVRYEIVDITAQALDFAVLGLVVVVDVDVHDGAVLGEARRDLFTDKEVGQRAAAVEQGLAAVDRVVIGDRNEIHPAPLASS